MSSMNVKTCVTDVTHITHIFKTRLLIDIIFACNHLFFSSISQRKKFICFMISTKINFDVTISYYNGKLYSLKQMDSLILKTCIRQTIIKDQ